MEIQNNIYIGDSALGKLNELLEKTKYTDVVCLVDEHTNAHCLPILKDSLTTIQFETVVIPAGEANKNLTISETVFEQMLSKQLDRKSLLINLGGGVVTDMGGFVASTYKRGIDFINIPTSLLAMVDASVGGKTGVNAGHIKNSVGTFSEPEAVFIYPPFLKTLTKQHLRNGFAEVLKHGIIADASYWEKMKNVNPTDASHWQEMIEVSVTIKADVVSQDYKEGGLRKILNFGHTVGHAIESVKLESEAPLLHGEAIAIGMLVEAQLSTDKGFLNPRDLADINEGILRHFQMVSFSPEEKAAIWPLITNDKKNTGAFVNCTLLRRIGKASFDVSINEEEVNLAWEKIVGHD